MLMPTHNISLCNLQNDKYYKNLLLLEVAWLPNKLGIVFFNNFNL